MMTPTDLYGEVECECSSYGYLPWRCFSECRCNRIGKCCISTSYSFVIDGRKVIVRVPHCCHYGYLSTPLYDAAEVASKISGRWLIKETQIGVSVWQQCEASQLWQKLAYQHSSPHCRFYVMRDIVRCFTFPKPSCCICGLRRRKLSREVEPGELRESALKVLLGQDLFRGQLRVCSFGDCEEHLEKAQRGSLGALVRLLGRHKAEKKRIELCKRQLKALRRYLRTNDPEVLTSLPGVYGPAKTSRALCRL